MCTMQRDIHNGIVNKFSKLCPQYEIILHRKTVGAGGPFKKCLPH